jgi:hypothetical protein
MDIEARSAAGVENRRPIPGIRDSLRNVTPPGSSDIREAVRTAAPVGTTAVGERATARPVDPLPERKVVFEPLTLKIEGLGDVIDKRINVRLTGGATGIED